MANSACGERDTCTREYGNGIVSTNGGLGHVAPKENEPFTGWLKRHAIIQCRAIRKGRKAPSLAADVTTGPHLRPITAPSVEGDTRRNIGDARDGLLFGKRKL